MKTQLSARLFCRLGCFLILFFQVSAAHSQVAGCKDPAANNYNPSATVNDGSCTYNQTFYTPPVKADSISSALVESSGLQWAGNSLWSFNDGGHSATLFRIDTASDAVLQTVSLQGVTNVDWEDIAFDGTHFYIGDFGNNETGARTDLKIYRFPLSIIPAYTTHSSFTIPAAEIKVIEFTYSDQPLPPTSTGRNNTKFDCEAMIVDNGKIHLFTKNWTDLNTTHYVINDTAAGTYVATPLETLATNYLVTGADRVPGSNVVVLIGYQNSGTGSHFLHLLSAFSGGLYFNGNKRQIDLPSAAEMGQVEGITFRNSSYGYISNEKFVRTILGITLTVHQKLRSFNTSQFISSSVLPLSLQKFEVKPVNNMLQVEWLFSEPAAQVSVQYGRNGVHFTNLKSFYNNGSGSLQHQSLPGLNYYRLSWKEVTGVERFSTIRKVGNEGKNQLANLVLSADGQLQVVNNGNRADGYRAKLFSVEGRTVAQASQFTLAPGLNKVRFDKQLNRHAILLLQMMNDKEEITKLLRVE